MRRPGLFEDGDDCARELRMLQDGQEGRSLVGRCEVPAKEHDEALFHQRLRHRLRAEARMRDLGQHQVERRLQHAVRRKGLHDRRMEQLEQAERAGVAVRDLPAHEERVRTAVSGREGDKAVTVQAAMILGPRLADTVLGLAERVRKASWHDDDRMAREGLPRPLSHPQASASPKHVMQRDRFERAEAQPPAALDPAHRKGSKPHGKRDEKTIENVGLHVDSL